MAEGYAINWSMGTGRDNIRNHPAYIKYSFKDIADIDPSELKESIGLIQYNTENQAISAYLSNLLRIIILLSQI
jgi:hypothetical protein